MSELYAKLVILIKGLRKTPSIEVMLGINDLKLRRCCKCQDFIPLTHHCIVNHYDKYHPEQEVSENDRYDTIIIKYVKSVNSLETIVSYKRKAFPNPYSRNELEETLEVIYIQTMEVAINEEERQESEQRGHKDGFIEHALRVEHN